MTFEEYWPTACLPGEYDSMDSCDQGRWRGVAQAAYQAGRDAMKAECVKVCEDIANKYNCMEEADARIAGQWCRDAIKELK